MELMEVEIEKLLNRKFLTACQQLSGGYANPSTYSSPVSAPYLLHSRLLLPWVPATVTSLGAAARAFLQETSSSLLNKALK